MPLIKILDKISGETGAVAADDASAMLLVNVVFVFVFVVVVVVVVVVVFLGVVFLVAFVAALPATVVVESAIGSPFRKSLYRSPIGQTNAGTWISFAGIGLPDCEVVCGESENEMSFFPASISF